MHDWRPKKSRQFPPIGCESETDFERRIARLCILNGELGTRIRPIFICIKGFDRFIRMNY